MSFSAESLDHSALQEPKAVQPATIVIWLIALVLLAALSLWFVLQAAWIDASTLGARAMVAGWRDGSGPRMTAEAWLKTRNELQLAVGKESGNAQLQDDLGYLHAARSQGMGKVPLGGPAHEIQQGLMELAIGHYRAACQLRPTFPYTWAYLAMSKHFRGQHDDEFWSAFDHAMQWGRSEAALQGILAEVAFALWPTLGSERQQSIALMVLSASDDARTTLLAMATQAGVKLPL